MPYLLKEANGNRDNKNETEGVNLSAPIYICGWSKLFCICWKHFSLISVRSRAQLLITTTGLISECTDFRSNGRWHQDTNGWRWRNGWWQGSLCAHRHRSLFVWHHGWRPSNLFHRNYSNRKPRNGHHNWRQGGRLADKGRGHNLVSRSPRAMCQIGLNGSSSRLNGSSSRLLRKRRVS